MARRISYSSSALVLYIFLICCARVATAQTPQPVRPAPSPTPARETSLTLAQIVSREKANFAGIKTAQGQVVWREERAGAAGVTTAPATRVIFFTREPDRSVNLVLPSDEAERFIHSGGKIDWSRVLSAVQIVGDVVSTLYAPPSAGSDPKIERVPYNPAVHESNPLVAFDPAMLADDHVTLADLAVAAAKMPTPPRLTELRGADGRLLVRIDFTNANAPGEAIYYFIDPAKACLPVEIGRVSGGKLASRIQIVIGNTRDGTFIPARRVKQTFDANGRVQTQETWYYEFLAVNEPLARKATSLEFFGVLETPATLSQGTPAAATPTPRSTGLIRYGR